MRVTEQIISESEKNLAETQEEFKSLAVTAGYIEQEAEYMTDRYEEAKAEISRLELKLSQLEVDLPELAAKMAMGIIDLESLNELMDAISENKKMTAIYESALPVMDTWVENARTERQQAEEALKKRRKLATV